MRARTTAIKRGMCPTHPGEIPKEDILPELGITQLELADRLCVSRRTVSEILRQRRPVKPDMAMRVGKAFNTSARFWLNLQAAVDLWKLANDKSKGYSKIVPLPVQTKQKAG